MNLELLARPKSDWSAALRAYLLAAVLCAFGNVASACSCAILVDPEDNIRDLLGRSKSVLEAEVIGVTEERVETPAKIKEETHSVEAPEDLETIVVSSYLRERAIWRVNRSWKGNYRPGSRIETVTRTGPCGAVHVQKAEVYLLYLPAPPYNVNECGSRRIENADRDVKILNQLLGAGS